MTDVRIKGWLKLSREQQKECISKLRYESLCPSSIQTCLANNTSELMRERDGQPQPVAVNATELEARLR